MFVPARLCPGNLPLVRSVSEKAILSILHATTPVTLHVSSIGNGVRPGRYVTLLGPSIMVVPVYLQCYCIDKIISQ